MKSHSSTAIQGGDNASITIGEALEATALTSWNRPVDQSDAAAIQAAEVRATGRGDVMPGGIGAEAQAAATLNTQIMRDEDKTKLGDVLVVCYLIPLSLSYFTKQDTLYIHSIIIRILLVLNDLPVCYEYRRPQIGFRVTNR